MPIFKKVNKDFFKKWTPDMAYVLGFFAADGYMSVNKFGGRYWCIQIIDKELIKEIKKVIGSEHKISVRKRTGNERDQYRIQIGNNEMFSDLNKLGYSTSKARNITVPEIPGEYLKDFVRGYFDGDGHVWVGLVHKERKTQTRVIQTVFTSCSEGFLNGLKNKLEKFNIDKGRLRKEKRGYFRLTYSVLNSLKLYNFMYNRLGTSKLFLQRKKGVFEEFIKMRL